MAIWLFQQNAPPVGTQRAASVTSKASKQHTKIQHCKRTLEIFEGLLSNKIQPYLIIRQIKIGTSKTSKTSQVSIFFGSFLRWRLLAPYYTSVRHNSPPTNDTNITNHPLTFNNPLHRITIPSPYPHPTTPTPTFPLNTFQDSEPYLLPIPCALLLAP